MSIIIVMYLPVMSGAHNGTITTTFYFFAHTTVQMATGKWRVLDSHKFLSIASILNSNYRIQYVSM